MKNVRCCASFDLSSSLRHFLRDFRQQTLQRNTVDRIFSLPSPFAYASPFVSDSLEIYSMLSSSTLHRDVSILSLIIQYWSRADSTFNMSHVCWHLQCNGQIVRNATILPRSPFRTPLLHISFFFCINRPVIRGCKAPYLWDYSRKGRSTFSERAAWHTIAPYYLKIRALFPVI